MPRPNNHKNKNDRMPKGGGQTAREGKNMLKDRKDLENVVYDYFDETISKSWTWERLTDDEKERFKNCIDFSKIKGTARQRVKMLNMVYAAFLQGVGYEPIGWREAETV